MPAKTGGGGGPWVPLERPKPARVADHYAYWLEKPPAESERWAYWLRQIERGWRPSRSIWQLGYDSSTQWYGVWIWEYLNRIYPALDAATGPAPAAPSPS